MRRRKEGGGEEGEDDDAAAPEGGDAAIPATHAKTAAMRSNVKEQEGLTSSGGVLDPDMALARTTIHSGRGKGGSRNCTSVAWEPSRSLDGWSAREGSVHDAASCRCCHGGGSWGPVTVSSNGGSRRRSLRVSLVRHLLFKHHPTHPSFLPGSKGVTALPWLRVGARFAAARRSGAALFCVPTAPNGGWRKPAPRGAGARPRAGSSRRAGRPYLGPACSVNFVPARRGGRIAPWWGRDRRGG